MPKTRRINIIVAADALDQIRALANAEGIKVSDWMRAAFEARATAAGVTLAHTPPHGGQRYTRCPQCGGWNVGRADGWRACADCGWREYEVEQQP